VKICNGFDGVSEVTTTAAVIAEDTPVLEACDGVLDACSTSAMETPHAIADDSVLAKHGCDELGDTSIAAVGEDAPVRLAQRLDERAAVVQRIVAISGSSSDGGDDAEVSSANEELCVAGPR
jgi:hypothetical protein